jgi:hypothetical protein
MLWPAVEKILYTFQLSLPAPISGDGTTVPNSEMTQPETTPVVVVVVMLTL